MKISSKKPTILIIDETFKTNDICNRRVTLEELFLNIIKKSEHEGNIPSKTL